MLIKDFTNQWTFYKDGSKNKEIVDLPHDAMLFEERNASNPSTGACACFAGGVYHYEKVFFAGEEFVDRCVQLYFEGVYQNAKVFLNGHEVTACAYGYSAFLADISDLRLREENVIEVTVDNSQMPNSRWYTGSGIYRPVQMLIAPKEHIVYQGVKISTESDWPAVIHVTTELSECAQKNEKLSVAITILKGKEVVATASGTDTLIQIDNALLWSDKTPNLYECRVSLHKGEMQIDRATETFGIRKITYSSKGLFVNGNETLLRGGCIHADNGIIGARSFKKSEWRRVKMLKEAGYNAIRSSHNPCSIEMLKACDYYGMYMLDESWDVWKLHKNKFDYADRFEENYLFDLESMVRKDYNHPSVIAYSIGNEVADPATPEGIELEKQLVSYLHALDTTRPVSAGINLMILVRSAQGNAIYKEDGGRDESASKQEEKKDSQKEDMPQGMPAINSSLEFNELTSKVGVGMNYSAVSDEADQIVSPALDALDIAGYNYASGRYPLEGEKHPDRILFGSETFPQDIGKNWDMVEKLPYLIGDFMWTAWDYLGEAGSGAWGYTDDAIGFEKPYPWILADMGAIDILGNPNAELYQAQAVWKRLEKPMIAVQPVNHSGVVPAKSVWRGTNAIPSWSWKDCDGNEAIVEVYYDASEIALYVNDTLVGKVKPEYCKAMFETSYTPGILKAVAYDDNGHVIGENCLVSANKQADLTICPEETTIEKGDIVYVNICLADDQSVVESNDDRCLEVKVDGGELLGFGSANPRTEESFVTGKYTTYYGYAQAIVRAADVSELKITVSDGTSTKTETIIVR